MTATIVIVGLILAGILILLISKKNKKQKTKDMNSTIGVALKAKARRSIITLENALNVVFVYQSGVVVGNDFTFPEVSLFPGDTGVIVGAQLTWRGADGKNGGTAVPFRLALYETAPTLHSSFNFPLAPPIGFIDFLPDDAVVFEKDGGAGESVIVYSGTLKNPLVFKTREGDQINPYPSDSILGNLAVIEEFTSADTNPCSFTIKLDIIY